MPPIKEKDTSKTRVFALAKELHLETKVLLEYCKELGFTGIKNQLAGLESDQVEALRTRVKSGPKKAAPGSARPSEPARPTIPTKLDSKIPTLSKPKPLPTKPAAPATPPPPPARSEVPPPKPAEKPPAAPEPAPTAAEVKPVSEPTPAPAAEVKPAPDVPPTPAAEPQPTVAEKPAPSEPPAEKPAPVPVAEKPAAPPPVTEKPIGASPPSSPVKPPSSGGMGGRVPPIGGGRPMNLNTPRSQPPRPGPPRSLQPRPPAPTPASGPTPPGGAPQRAAPVAFGPTPQRPGANVPPPGGRPVGPGHRGPGGMPPRNAAVGGGPPRVGPPSRTPGNKQVQLTPEMIDRLRKLEQQRGQQRVNIQDIQRLVIDPDAEKAAGPGTDRPARPGTRPPMPGGPGGGPASGSDDDRRSGPGGKKPGEVAGRDSRTALRHSKKGRQQGSSTDRGSVIITGGRVEMIDRKFGSRIKKPRGMRRNKGPVPVITGKVEIAMPITVRSLSEAIGMKANDLIMKLRQATNSLYPINSNVELEVAEEIAIERDVELIVKKQDTAEDIVLREIEERTKAREEHLIPRPPIVTIMGHVDHGKTSLLDKIRQEYGFSSDVVSTETGGITQVLRAWRVEKDGHPITFLDTPGHEAFTKMRARGANVTDIAVIVVSAADGVMPQTQEAVSHAKAANVDIIVAINKCDLPGAQPDKVKARLLDMELVPEDMGGEVPVIYTSAVSGQGVGELLDNIALRAEFAELKADPDQPATGTCLEGYQTSGEGVMATLLVGNGTLHKGDVLLCGSTFGKVRAMYNDLGKPIDEAGPSSPVRITGLGAVPDADDPFYVVDDITTARVIAEKRADIRLESERFRSTPKSLDELRAANAQAKITELKVILKAEARGSVEAIKKELEKLTHEEVRTRVLHAGIGAITESDVTLALTSPADTLLVGFNVTTDDAAMKLAEQRGVSVREYQIIYNLTDDIKAALEGRLKPVEEVVHLGRAVVRQTFKVGKVGTIAGCYVTSGLIERNSKVRVIREGAVIYPPAEKTASLDNLKRFKDDAKEVREGFECGMKLAGFDDIKVGDVIEAFKIEIRQRTL